MVCTTMNATAVQMMGPDSASLKAMTFRADGTSVHIAGSMTAAELDGAFATVAR